MPFRSSPRRRGARPAALGLAGTLLLTGAGLASAAATVPTAAPGTSSTTGRAGALAGSAPVGNVESAIADGTAVTVVGWAVDPDEPSPVTLHYYVDGAWGGAFVTDVRRGDLVDAVPGATDSHGFSRTFPASPGRHEVCVHAIDTTVDRSTPLGCRGVDVTGNLRPVGDLNSLRRASATTFTITGWAFDRDEPGPVTVHYDVDGQWGGAVVTDVPRADVVAAHPTAGARQGFEHTFTAGPGNRTVCAYAIDTTHDTHTPLGCQSAVLGNRLPVGRFDSLTVDGWSVSVRGWALDPDAPGPVTVHLYVGGAWGGPLATDDPRPDVDAGVEGAGPRQGFARTFVAVPGPTEVCAYAIDNQLDAHTPLGCRTVVVETNRLPRITIESLTQEGETMTVTGWALDPDTAGPVDVHVYLNGRFWEQLRTDVQRPDVAAAYPGTGDLQGFTTSFPVPSRPIRGPREVCLYAIDTSTGASTRACRWFD